MTVAHAPENLRPRGGRTENWRSPPPLGMERGTAPDACRLLFSAFSPAAFACLPLACALSEPAAAAQNPVEAFYKGKQIAMVVGSSAGGGYDTYARLLARTMGSAIPGNHMIVVQNIERRRRLLQPLLSDQPVPHRIERLDLSRQRENDVYVCYVRSDAPSEDLQGRYADAEFDRRQQSGATTYLRSAAAAQQHPRHQDRHRLSGSREITLSARERGKCKAPAASVDRHRDHAQLVREDTPSACSVN